MTPLPNRFPILRALALGALALLVAMLVFIHPASAESDAASCATGGAVEAAANNPGLVSDTGDPVGRNHTPDGEMARWRRA